MRRCGHCLVHRVGAPGSRERMLRLLAERGDMSQSDFVYLLELRSASVSELLGKPVIMAADVVGPDAQAKAAALQPGQIMLLENTRFEKGETKNDPALAKASSPAVAVRPTAAA